MPKIMPFNWMMLMSIFATPIYIMMMNSFFSYSLSINALMKFDSPNKFHSSW